ncbi:TPA: EAL domain-containing protein [Legionella pneumophila]|uniref:sensor domain-containing protein n=1 Tax=Legionella pneumophila TaxID=446 RepID=UPI00077722C0|nr:bifunctional diguanylate cyclase/phosphodiesterase [Legionella pneumophila]
MINIIKNRNKEKHTTSNELQSEIEKEQVKLLFDQVGMAISGEALAVTILPIALWSVTNHELLIIWMIFTYVFSDLYKSMLLFYYNKQPTLFSTENWLFLFNLGVVSSGLAWGFASSIMIPASSTLHQIFVVFLITGVTAAANSLYSPVRLSYFLFLVTAFVPFTIWLFSKGQVYLLLGFCGIIYMGIMLFISYYSNRILINTLKMRFKISNLNSTKDILEKKVADRTKELEKILALTKSTLESTADGILVVDLKGNIEFCNQQFLKMWGISPGFIDSHNDTETIQYVLNQLKNPEEFLKQIKELYNNPKQESFDELHFKDGKIFERYSQPHWLDNKIVGRVWSYRDVTLRTRLAYQANHDSLTGLPNRTALYDRLEHVINYCKRLNTSLSVFFLDIDNFKLINDSLGHDAGDILLYEFSRRLKGCIRHSDTVARFGGDEFVLLLITTEPKDVILVAQNILKAVAQPIKLPTQEVIVTTSIGISLFPKDGIDANTLLKNSDTAMYLAKKEGRNNFQFYNNSINQQSLKRLEIQTQIHNAIKNNEFFILYQPIYNLRNGELVGAEALIRWGHPAIGLLSPDEFIPIAEETGLINQVGEWVLRNACIQNKTWQLMGLPHISISVNVSWRQLKNSNFIEIAESVLKESRLDPQYLEIEFTESTMIQKSTPIDSMLVKISQLGIKMAIDDFGTGYSNLSYLKTFPFNKLKIDRSFIQNCTTNPNDASIVEAIIAMAHSLELKVLAEGVDTIDKAFFMHQHGCDEVQGFLYGLPVKADQFVKLMQKNRIRHSKFINKT